MNTEKLAIKSHTKNVELVKQAKMLKKHEDDFKKEIKQLKQQI